MKNMNLKNNKLLFGVILAFVFIASVSFTYAYFSAGITGNDTATDQIVTAGTLSISFTDGPQLVGSEWYPNDSISKTFEIENTGTLGVYYTINWAELLNNFENGELVVSIRYFNSASNRSNNINPTLVVTSQPIGLVAGIITSPIYVAPGTTQYYYLEVLFIETSSQQNYNQNKTFTGTLSVTEAVEEYTLNGVLLDASENPISGATVTIHSEPQTTVTNSNGEFSFSGLKPETHTIVATNSSNEQILNDTLVISTNNSSGINIENKTITSNYNNQELNIMVKLSNTNTISSLSFVPTSEEFFTFYV